MQGQQKRCPHKERTASRAVSKQIFAEKREDEETFHRTHLTLHSNPVSFSLEEGGGDFFSSLLFAADADGRFVSFSAEGVSGEAINEANMKKIYIEKERFAFNQLSSVKRRSK